MRTIRKIFLQSPTATRLSLNGENGIYASELAGFGFEKSPSYTPLGQGFFRNLGVDEDTQGSPSFNLVFATKQPYLLYQHFLTWVAKAGSLLELVYAPYGTTEYLRKVELVSIGKGELNEVGWLICPVVFMTMGLWMQPLPTQLLMDASAEVMRFPLTFDDNTTFGINSQNAMAVEIMATGQSKSGLLLRYRGAIRNPRINLVGKVTGKNYGVCAVSVEIQHGEQLELSTLYEDSHIYKIAESGEITDLIDEIDITRNPYMRVPITEPCILSMEAATEINGTAELMVYNYYRSV